MVAGYHPYAVLQNPTATYCGTAQISDVYANFFKVKPVGAALTIHKKQTVCGAAAPCVSYIWYTCTVTWTFGLCYIHLACTVPSANHNPNPNPMLILSLIPNLTPC